MAEAAVTARFSPLIQAANAEEARALEALRRAQDRSGDSAVRMGRDRMLGDGRNNSAANTRVRNARRAYEQAKRDRDMLLARRERLTRRVLSRVR